RRPKQVTRARSSFGGCWSVRASSSAARRRSRGRSSKRPPAPLSWDEVDRIRSQVGGEPNVAGIRAQEALLTLIENEAVAFTLPDWAGGGRVNLDSSGLLFVCAGAVGGVFHP